jgi:hypothetical protein
VQSPATQNLWLVTGYYIVHFYLLSPKIILVRVHIKTNHIGYHARVMVHVKVKVML